MDSLTQLTLGGAVLGAIAGRKYGRKAMLAGAIIGTLPDLDVFIPYGDDLSNMIEHRGFSHSLIMMTLFAPFLTWMFSKIKWFDFDGRDKQLHIAVWLALVTHILLDAMTIYGTQLLWPLTKYPFGVGSVFIIDPLYTVPLLIACGVFLWTKRVCVIRIGLLVSTAYLVWSVAVQSYVTNIAKQSLDGQEYTQMISLPTPFNTFLWRVLVMDNKGYQVGYYSIFDTHQDIAFQKFDNETVLPDSYDVQRLIGFTKGYYGLVGVDDKMIMQDLRMGLEPNQYVFQYVVATVMEGKVHIVPNARYRVPRNIEGRLEKIWNRIWNEDASVHVEE